MLHAFRFANSCWQSCPCRWVIDFWFLLPLMTLVRVLCRCVCHCLVSFTSVVSLFFSDEFYRILWQIKTDRNMSHLATDHTFKLRLRCATQEEAAGQPVGRSFGTDDPDLLQFRFTVDDLRWLGRRSSRSGLPLLAAPASSSAGPRRTNCTRQAAIELISSCIWHSPPDAHGCSTTWSCGHA